MAPRLLSSLSAFCLLFAFAALADEGADGSLWTRDTLTGDWGGLRTRADDAGVKLSGVYTAESLGNLSGGLRQRAVVMGNLELDLDLDFAKLAGQEGLTLHASAFQLHGRGLGNNFVGNLFAVRDIEAAPNTRLWALWLQQKFAGDSASVRLGQMPWQEEFGNSAYGAYFTNGAFGWPSGFSLNMVNGGGGYPLASTGARLAVSPADKLNLQVAAFDGDPAIHNVRGQDPSRKNTTGLNFRLKTPPVFFAEGAYGSEKDSSETELPTMVKLGAWYHTGRFDDPHWSSNGSSLGSPSSSGLPLGHRGNWMVYGMLDTMLWRDSENSRRSIGAFVRLMGGPDDRNQMPYYGDAGLTWQGMIEGRDEDVAGIALAYGRASRALAAQDRDALASGSSLAPVHSYEMAVEALYRAQLTPWWTLVPDAQYIVHPGGGAAVPGTAERIPDAWIVGLRTVFKL